ncbi:MAG TPA: tetratricopeptide repeat protein [Candidatus Binatia bacterium]
MEELARSIDRLPWDGAGREALTVFNKARELKPTDADAWYKLGLMLYDGEYYQQALEALRRSAELSGDKTNTRFVALVWQGHILDILGHRDLAIQQYKLALNIPGQQSHADQYNMTINQKWVEERLLKPFVRK